MRSHPLHFKNLIEVGQMIRQGQVTSVEITGYMLNRIASVDEQFKSYIHVCGDRALEKAQAVDT